MVVIAEAISKILYKGSIITSMPLVSSAPESESGAFKTDQSDWWGVFRLDKVIDISTPFLAVTIRYIRVASYAKFELYNRLPFIRAKIRAMALTITRGEDQFY